MPAPCLVEASFLRLVFEDGRVFDHDVVVYPDGRAERRDAKSLSKRYADLYGHTPLSLEELRVYLGRAGEVDCIFVGTGVKGAMRLTGEAEEFLKSLMERGVEVYVVETPRLVGLCGALRRCRRPLMVIHSTC